MTKPFSAVMRRTLPAMCLVVAAGVLAAATTMTPARASDTTVSYDKFRTGWDPNEPSLQPAAADFGQLFGTNIGGPIYAQPIVVQSSGTSNGTLIAATEENQVAALDPATGAIRWERSLGAPWHPSVVKCGSTGTLIGVTSTPVYDNATRSVYVMAKADDGPDARHPSWKLHALNPTTGKDRSGWPVQISGAPDNDPAHPFIPRTEAQRPGLLLLGGVVYAGFASMCDHGPYVGDVVGVSTTTHRVTAMWSTEAGTADGEAGIWQSGGGLASDGAGQILLVTGNGETSAPSPGHDPPDHLGEAVVRLQVAANGKLHASDYFAPVNATLLNTDDTDLGSGGPLAIPGSFDGKRLMVVVGKDGRVFLLDRDSLGGSAQGPGGTDDVLGVTGPFNGVWGHPAYWPGPNAGDGQGGYVYDVENQGYLRVFRLGTDSSGGPVLTSIGTSAQTFGYTSGSPVVTSDGTTAGSALVWVTSVNDAFGSNGTLRVYSAVPQNGVLPLVASFPIGTGAKFNVAATDHGRVFVANRAGEVFGFGTPTAAAVEASPTDFGTVPVGTDSTIETVDITATRTVTVNQVTTSAPFAVTSAVTQTTLNPGQTLHVDVQFSPTQAGEIDNPLVVQTTENGTPKTVDLDLFGTGTQPGLAANPGTLAFGQVPTGASKTFDVNIVNTGTTAVQLDPPVLSPSANSPFAIVGGSPAGATIQPQGALAVPVSYTPTQAESDDATLTFTGSGGGTVATVDLSGTAVSGQAHLDVSPNPLVFGRLPLGTSATQTFKVRNTGNIALTISKAAQPGGAFTTDSPVDEGLTLAPGEGVVVPIRFQPRRPGPADATYTFNSDAHDEQVEVLSGSATDPIAQYHTSLGGHRSYLGRATGAEHAVSDGRVRNYSGGAIYWSASTGPHALRGPILAHYRKLGGPAAFPGFPISDVSRVRHRAGEKAEFAGSRTAIYYSKSTGAHEVHGGIRQAWLATGGVHGKLGYPVTDEVLLGHHRRRSTFQHGWITYHRSGRTTVHYKR